MRIDIILVCLAALLFVVNWAVRKYGPKKSRITYIDLPDYVDQRAAAAQSAIMPIVPDLVIPADGGRPFVPGQYQDIPQAPAFRFDVSGSGLPLAPLPPPPGATRDVFNPADLGVMYRLPDQAARSLGSNGSSDLSQHG